MARTRTVTRSTHTDRVDRFLAELKSHGTRYRAANQKRYLKSKSTFYGVTVPKTRSLARSYAAPYREDEDLTSALSFSRALWADGAHESKMAAVMVVCACEALYDDRVWTLGYRWLSRIDNWALCDGIGPGMLAPFAQIQRSKHRSRRREVQGWTGHPNPWVRRGALLCTLRSTRQDKEWEFLFRVAVPLIEDPDYFVQKGLGWMLRECAHHNPREVITFIQRHRDRMRRSTITNAVSRLPKTLQKAARSGS